MLSTLKEDQVKHQHIIRIILSTVLIAVTIAKTALVYKDVIDLTPALKRRTFEAYFRIGIPEAVKWIKNQEIKEIYIEIKYEDDRYLYERLGEMIYPVTLKPFDMKKDIPENHFLIISSSETNHDITSYKNILQNQYISILENTK